MYNLVNILRTVEQTHKTKPVLNILNQTVRAYEIQLQLFAIGPSK